MGDMAHIASVGQCQSQTLSTVVIGDRLTAFAHYDGNLHAHMGDEPVMGNLHAGRT
jgi:hypothetical protein